MSNTLEKEESNLHNKVIKLRKVQSDIVDDSMDESERSVSLDLKIQHAEKQLKSLEQQRDKILGQLKESIDLKKKEWQSEKEIERQQAEKLGYEIGFEQAKSEVIEQYSEILNSANEITNAAQQDYYKTVEKHEKAIITLAMHTAEKIMKDEITKEPESLMPIITTAIEGLKDQSKVVIYVHPNDYQFVLNQKNELEVLTGDDSNISILVDQHANVGDCVIKYPFGQIDVGIDSQLQQIKEALIEKVMGN